MRYWNFGWSANKWENQSNASDQWSKPGILISVGCSPSSWLIDLLHCKAVGTFNLNSISIE